MSANLEDFPDVRDSEFLFVKLVENHRVRRFEIGNVALNQIPRPLERIVDVDAHDLHRILAAVVTLPLRPSGDELLRIPDARNSSYLIQLALAEGHSLLYIRDIL